VGGKLKNGKTAWLQMRVEFKSDKQIKSEILRLLKNDG